MIASHYVIADLAESVADDDPDHTLKLFSKFTDRYHGDDELSGALILFKSYLKSKDKKQLSKVKKSLASLLECRRIEAGGLGVLPYPSLRTPSAGRLKLDDSVR